MSIQLIILGELSLVFFAAIITGILVKIADILEDHEHKIEQKIILFSSSILGIIYGTIIALFIFNWPTVIPLAIGTFVGLFLSRKFDAVGHYFGVIMFVLLASHLYNTIGNLVEFDLIFFMLILIFVIANILEEFVNDFLDNPLLKKYPFLKKLMGYRLILEITAFITSLLLNEWLIWVTIFAFDVGYHLIEKTIGKRWGKPKNSPVKQKNKKWIHF